MQYYYFKLFIFIYLHKLRCILNGDMCFMLKTKKVIKKFFSYLFIIILFVITIGILINNISYKTAVEIYHNSNKVYIFLGLLAQCSIWLLDSAIIYSFAKNINEKIRIRDAFKNAMIGQYYGLITPYQSGAQPAQIYHFGNKLKMPYGKATAIQLDKFVIYQTVITVLGLLVFFTQFNYLVNKLHSAFPFIIVGIIVHASIGFIIFFTIFSPGLIHKALVFILELGHKLKFFKGFDEKIKNIDKYMEDYKNNVSLASEEKKLIIKVIILTVIQTILNFSITFLVYKALNLKGQSYIEVFTLQTMLFLAVSSVPIPGTVGASEIGFYTILQPVFGGGIISYAIIVWRGITYYFNILVSGIFVFIFHIRDSKAESRKNSLN